MTNLKVGLVSLLAILPADGFIRRLALQNKVCYTTTLAGGEAFCIAIRHQREADGGGEIVVRRLQDLHAQLTD